MPFSWDTKSLRYRGQGGRFVRRDAVTSAVESAIDEAARRAKNLSTRLQTGEISLPEWTLGMRDIIKANHLLTAGIAQGGKAQLSPAALGRIGAQTRVQYQYLQRFSRQIANGLPLNGRFLARAQMYAAAARGTFSETERRIKRDAGFDEEINVLNAKESCSECEAEAGKGWVKIGTLKPVGSRICRTNCRCEISIRKAA